MKSVRRWLSFGAAVSAVLMIQATAVSQASRPLVLRHARLIQGDGQVLFPSGMLVIQDGRFTGIGADGALPLPPNAETIDLAGKTVTPGIVNAHGHVADTSGLQSGAQFYTEANLVAQLKRYAMYGVTTVFSLGGDDAAGFKLRDAERDGPLDRARVRLAGPVIPAATTLAGVAAEVDRVAAMKPNLIKIRVDDNLGTTPKMSLDVARAVIEQAHKHNLKVAAHIFYLDDARVLLRAGVDFIAHSIRDLPVDAEVIQLLKARNVCVCPTLMREVSTFVYEQEPDFFKDPFFLKSADPAVLTALREPQRQAQMRASKSAQRYKVALEQASANLKALSAAGVRIAMGTDTGPPARFQGYFEHMELELMARAGLSPAAVVAAATGAPGDCLGIPNTGYLRRGSYADFLILSADPLADVRNFRSIESVWIGGKNSVK